MNRTRKYRSLRPSAGAGLLLLGTYLGCEPDLDPLSSEYGRGGAGQGGAAKGGASESGGGGGTSGGGVNGGAPAGGKLSFGGGMSGGEAGMQSGGASGGVGPTTGGVDAGGSGGVGASGGVAGGAAGSGGEGGVVCGAGLTTCPGSAECSTDLQKGNASGKGFTDCGACGTTCGLSNASAATCNSGNCVPTCSTGFGDCNATTANDGCETDLATAGNCGACGHACSRSGTSALACTASKCAPTCQPKYADCNSDVPPQTDDGCEVYLDALKKCGTSCTNGIACGATQVCNAGVCGAAQGVVALGVPFTAASQIQRYADRFMPAYDLTNAPMTLRLYAPGATGGQVNIYMSDADFTGSNGVILELNTLSQGWVDVTVPIAGVQGAFDPSVVTQVNLEVQSGATGPWTNPTVLYIDGIRTTNGLVNDTFDASLGRMFQSQSLAVAGSTMTWLNAVP